MDITDLYDEIDDAPVLKFDKPPTARSGAVVKAARVDDKYAQGQIPAFTLRLDEPTDDGDECGVLLARSELMQRAIGKAVRRTGRGRRQRHQPRTGGGVAKSNPIGIRDQLVELPLREERPSGVAPLHCRRQFRPDILEALHDLGGLGDELA